MLVSERPRSFHGFKLPWLTFFYRFYPIIGSELFSTSDRSHTGEYLVSNEDLWLMLRTQRSARPEDFITVIRWGRWLTNMAQEENQQKMPSANGVLTKIKETGLQVRMSRTDFQSVLNRRQGCVKSTPDSLLALSTFAAAGAAGGVCGVRTTFAPPDWTPRRIMFDALRVSASQDQSQDHPSTRVGVPRESKDGERRVALVPKTVEKLTGRGLQVVVESGAGVGALMPDELFIEAGATIGNPWDVDVVVKVAPPTDEEIGRLHRGSVLVGFLAPRSDPEIAGKLRDAGVTAFAMESIPRISRA